MMLRFQFNNRVALSSCNRPYIYLFNRMDYALLCVSGVRGEQCRVYTLGEKLV